MTGNVGFRGSGFRVYDLGSVREGPGSAMKGGFKNSNEIPKYVTQARAAYLLGLPPEEICRISQEAGVGHLEKTGVKEEWYFTYEELQKIRLLAVHASDTTCLL